VSTSTLLQCLQGVRKSGRGWTAKCPAHEDRSASLSIAETDDGRVLIHCFANCSAHDVLDSLGLSMTDLFPERERDYSPAGRVAAREVATARKRSEALAALLYATSVVQAAAGVAGLWLFDAADRDLLAQSVDDIARAVGVLA
jgi:DNA primase